MQLTEKGLSRSLPTDGELTSVKISEDSRFALINHAPDVRNCWISIFSVFTDGVHGRRYIYGT